MEMQRSAASSFSKDGGRERAPFEVDFPFTKAVPDDKAKADAGVLILRGYASTWVQDRDGEYVDSNAFNDSLPAYLKKNPIILWQHDQDQPIGTMTAAEVDENGLLVEVEIPKPGDKEPDWAHLAYNKIKSGIVRTFSIGGFFEREFVMGRAVITRVELMETSVVSIPSNPDSIFEAAAKALKTAPARPQLLQGHIKQMKQILGAEPITDPELAVMTPAERVERYTVIADAYLKAGKVAPAIDEWKQLEPELETIGSKEQAVDLTRRIVALVKKINGGVVDEKGGRVLSRHNESKLRDVRGLLDQMEKQVDDLAEQAKSAIVATKNELDVVLKQVEDDSAETPDDAPAADEPTAESGEAPAETDE